MSDSSRKTVAVIGAGVSGLVSAVSMLKVGIRPTIFEKASGVGGIWNTDVTPCWKSLRTNTSKFSTVLPDYAWPEHTRMFPTQREAFSYLSNYAQQSLPSDIFLLNTTVTNISRTNDATNRWTVHYCTKDDEPTSDQYDFVIVAAGIYASRQIPKDIVGLASFPGTILHSCDYRSPEQIQGKRVIIVGASISATEIAADTALKAIHVIHIASRQFWPVPRFTPVKHTDPASPFLPRDLNAYRHSTRTSKSEILFRNASDYRKLNSYCRSLLGNDQPFSHIFDNNDDELSYIIFNDMYFKWNQIGRISLQHGRLIEVNENGTLTLDNGTTIGTTSNDVLLLCTGYRPNLDFFSSDILEQLSYKPDDIFCPLILYRDMLPWNIPGLGFIGMFRGPFWMVLELQARWIAAVFSGALPMPSISEQQIGIDIQHRVRNQQPRPQYPHSDFVGVSNDLAKDLGLLPSNITDSIISTHYRNDGSDPVVIAEYNAIVEAASQGRFVAGVVFRALLESKWVFERTLTDQSAVTDTTRGQAQFKLLEQGQLLYSEEDKRSSSSSISTTESVPTAQKYMYVYDEDTDSLTVYFVDSDNMRGSLFLKIQFQSRKTTEQAGWIATGDHQCNDVHYSVSYLFVFTGVQLARLEISYVVNGRTKDYVSTTIFRPAHLAVLE